MWPMQRLQSLHIDSKFGWLFGRKDEEKTIFGRATSISAAGRQAVECSPNGHQTAVLAAILTAT